MSMHNNGNGHSVQGLSGLLVAEAEPPLPSDEVSTEWPLQQSLEAQELVIAAVQVDGELLREARVLLAPSDFLDEKCRAVYELCLALAGAVPSPPSEYELRPMRSTG